LFVFVTGQRKTSNDTCRSLERLIVLEHGDEYEMLLCAFDSIQAFDGKTGEALCCSMACHPKARRKTAHHMAHDHQGLESLVGGYGERKMPTPQIQCYHRK
jgi:hypothetical protein